MELCLAKMRVNKSWLRTFKISPFKSSILVFASFAWAIEVL